MEFGGCTHANFLHRFVGHKHALGVKIGFHGHIIGCFSFLSLTGVHRLDIGILWVARMPHSAQNAYICFFGHPLVFMHNMIFCGYEMLRIYDVLFLTLQFGGVCVQPHSACHMEFDHLLNAGTLVCMPFSFCHHASFFAETCSSHIQARRAAAEPKVEEKKSARAQSLEQQNVAAADARVVRMAHAAAQLETSLGCQEQDELNGCPKIFVISHFSCLSAFFVSPSCTQVAVKSISAHAQRCPFFCVVSCHAVCARTINSSSAAW